MSVRATTTDCGCHNDLECGSLPPNFVRMRYYFGQRLGVSDFFDEQAYHEGKRRMLNRRLHGDGVVCGLLSHRFVWPQDAPPDTPTTLVRVERGIALDACGREIVVGTDQCVDVNAWYLANKERPEIAAWEGSDAENRLWIGLRYRECPSDPAPAPRDPCGCDDGGCEFGRVRESFELRLLTESERAGCARDTFPAGLEARLAGLAASPSTCADYADAITELVGCPCPDPSPDPWLCLAAIDLTLEAGQVFDVTVVDNTIPSRRSLLSTATLQSLIVKSLCQPGLAVGPAIGGASFDADAGSLVLHVQLVPDPADPATTVPIETATFDASHFTLSEFQAGSGWSDVGISATYEAASERFVVTPSGGAIAAGRYRLVFEAPRATPLVDIRMNPIHPSPFTWQFRLVEQDGALALSESLFD